MIKGEIKVGSGLQMSTSEWTVVLFSKRKLKSGKGDECSRKVMVDPPGLKECPELRMNNQKIPGHTLQFNCEVAGESVELC